MALESLEAWLVRQRAGAISLLWAAGASIGIGTRILRYVVKRTGAELFIRLRYDGGPGAVQKYCGAVAVSWYRSEYTLRAIDMLLDVGRPTYDVLGNNAGQAIYRLPNMAFQNT